MAKELSLYVHIPFCVRKCLYCDFLSFYAEESLQARYFESLSKEIWLWGQQYKDRRVISVFFGGGTPSFPGSKEVCRLLDTIRDNFDVDSGAEISIEVNPASAMREKLVDYRRAGFNRISIGAQSLNDAELRALGRAHDSGMFFHTYDSARDAGFDNVNVDIMSALPGQSLKSYLDTVEKVTALKPEHVSAYSLILEEGTPFYDMELDLPNEDTDRRMYHETGQMLASSGYHRYEISNYAREGFECRHNKVYWRRGDYLGLGIGAASLMDNVRWSNVRDLNTYIDGISKAEALDSGSFDRTGIREGIEELTGKSQMEEFMFLGLRLTKGVSRQLFLREFGKDMMQVYGDVIRKYERMGLLEWASDGDGPESGAKAENGAAETGTAEDEEYLRLTDRGLDVSNTVMADFLLD